MNSCPVVRRSCLPTDAVQAACMYCRTGCCSKAQIASSTKPTTQPPPCHCIFAGNFALLPGATRLTALRSLAIDGNIASLGDVWQHTGLTQLVLVNSHEQFPEPLHDRPCLPALQVAEVGSTTQALPQFWDWLLLGALRHVTALVSKRASAAVCCVTAGASGHGSGSEFGTMRVVYSYRLPPLCKRVNCFCFAPSVCADPALVPRCLGRRRRRRGGL